jgi:hypothetical protein
MHLATARRFGKNRPQHVLSGKHEHGTLNGRSASYDQYRKPGQRYCKAFFFETLRHRIVSKSYQFAESEQTGLLIDDRALTLPDQFLQLLGRQIYLNVITS